MGSLSARSGESKRTPSSQATPVVFVVDDDVSVRESLESLIRCAGWQAETFRSAEAFLARPRVPAPSCLVLDVSLPGLDGLDLQDTRLEVCDYLRFASDSAISGNHDVIVGVDTFDKRGVALLSGLGSLIIQLPYRLLDIFGRSRC